MRTLMQMLIVFNLIEKNPTRYIIKKAHRVTWFNYLRYGTARISIRLDKIKKNAIYFNQCFGGGTDYSHGEDNLFLTSCLKNKMKIYALPIELAELTEERVSTWNKGYDKKYFTEFKVHYIEQFQRNGGNYCAFKMLCDMQNCINRHQ